MWRKETGSEGKCKKSLGNYKRKCNEEKKNSKNESETWVYINREKRDQYLREGGGGGEQYKVRIYVTNEKETERNNELGVVGA